MANLPAKPLRRILKQNCPLQISNDAVIVLRQNLEKFALDISHEALLIFNELNKVRQRQGLKPLRRLNERAVRGAIENVLKHESNMVMGLQSNGATSPGDEMLIDKFVTKPERTTDDDGEVV